MAKSGKVRKRGGKWKRSMVRKRKRQIIIGKERRRMKWQKAKEPAEERRHTSENVMKS